MLRHLLREQIKRVEDGLDPMNVMRDVGTALSNFPSRRISAMTALLASAR